MTSTTENELLALARQGDTDAFDLLVEPRRAELHAHCYRMLGSVHDAEDVLQEALLRIWRGLPRFEGRSSLRVWMYTVTTNACLAALGRRSRRARLLPIASGPPAAAGEAPADFDREQPWIEPYPGPEARYEETESVELAFVAALQHLPPNERAVLLLREVLGFSAREIADQLGTTTAAVSSALQRARGRVDGRLPSPSQQEVRRSLGEAAVRSIVDRYTDAMQRGDVHALVALLAEDATWSMPPIPTWYQGREAIATFLRCDVFSHRWRRLPTRASGQPAVAAYLWDGATGSYVGLGVDVLTLRGAQIAAVTGFLDRVHIERLGLPLMLPAD